MLHLYKLHIPNSDVDFFFSALNREEKTFSLMVVTKDGVPIRHPETKELYNKVSYRLNKDVLLLDGIGQLERVHYDVMDKYFNQPEQSEQAV